VTYKGETISLIEEGAQGQLRREPHLFLELECDRPLVGPARWRLNDVDQVKVGRGGSRCSNVASRVLSIQVPDGRVSVEHVEIRRTDGVWIARDLGAKNRMLVDGQSTAEAELGNGDLLQLGHTFLRFRTDVLAVGPATVDFQAGVGPLSTLSLAFAAVVERSAAIARSRVPVLLVGGSGTGRKCWPGASTRNPAAEGCSRRFS